MELDHTVLLVDADVARPSVQRYLQLKPEADSVKIGLMDILLDPKLDLADAILKTNIDTLSLLPAGKSHHKATELLPGVKTGNMHRVRPLHCDQDGVAETVVVEAGQRGEEPFQRLAAPRAQGIVQGGNSVLDHFHCVFAFHCCCLPVGHRGRHPRC